MSDDKPLPTEEEVLDAVRTLYAETPVESAGLARAASKLYAFARGNWGVNADPASKDPALTAPDGMPEAKLTAADPPPDAVVHDQSNSVPGMDEPTT